MVSDWFSLTKSSKLCLEAYPSPFLSKIYGFIFYIGLGFARLCIDIGFLVIFWGLQRLEGF